jgi:nitrate reductase (NAD(P)H)
MDSDKENDSYYHIWDNRVLPVSSPRRTESLQPMFAHPDTACNEQNLNSVIVKPAQGGEDRAHKGEERKRIEFKDTPTMAVGTRCRVEVSLDGGDNWLYCIRKVSLTSLMYYPQQVWC